MFLYGCSVGRPEHKNYQGQNGGWVVLICQDQFLVEANLFQDFPGGEPLLVSPSQDCLKKNLHHTDTQTMFLYGCSVGRQDTKNIRSRMGGGWF